MRFILTQTVTVDIDGPVVHLAHGLNLQVVAVDAEVALPLHIRLQVLSDVLAEIISVLLLKMKMRE